MSNLSVAPELHTLANEFRWNAEHALRDASPFYEKLAYRVADDPDMFALAAHAQPHQPPVNFFFVGALSHAARA
jgi:hypothetical protein